MGRFGDWVGVGGGVGVGVALIYEHFHNAISTPNLTPPPHLKQTALLYLAFLVPNPEPLYSKWSTITRTRRRL